MGLLGEIARQEQRAPPFGLDDAPGLGRVLVLVPVGDRDVGALAREQPRARLALAVAGAPWDNKFTRAQIAKDIAEASSDGWRATLANAGAYIQDHGQKRLKKIMQGQNLRGERDWDQMAKLKLEDYDDMREALHQEQATWVDPHDRWNVAVDFAGAVLQLLATTKVSPKELGFVASHGQTIWHEPGRATFQLGDAAVIAERLGVPVVSDFRARDVAAGGQGAPLVPLADVMLFGDDLGDFISEYRVSAQARMSGALKYNEWGRKWFMLPSPMYGSWESSLYDFVSGLSPEEISRRKFRQLP